MPKHGENSPESTSTSARPQNTTSDDAKNKKSDGENEFDDEMIADGKLYKYLLKAIIDFNDKVITDDFQEGHQIKS